MSWTTTGEYLAAVQLDPRNLAARYSVALVALKFGAVEEAAHHWELLKKFARPGDERVRHLTEMVLAAKRATAQTAVAKAQAPRLSP